MSRHGYVLASRKYGTLYTGVTRNLNQRVWQHKNGINKGFTYRYNVNKLVYFEEHENIQDAIAREKQIKNWQRAWKIQLIESVNSDWKDLYEDMDY